MEVQTQIFAQNGVSWWSRHLQGACRFKEQKGGRPKVYPWLLFENTISRWGKKLSILTNSEKSTLAIKQTLLCLIENYELSFGPDSSSLKQNNLFVLEKEQICPIIISPRRITLTTKPPTKALRIVSTTITHTKTANLTNKYLFAGQTKALLYASRSRSRNSAQTYKIPPINPPPLPPNNGKLGQGEGNDVIWAVSHGVIITQERNIFPTDGATVQQIIPEHHQGRTRLRNPGLNKTYSLLKN